MKIKVEGCMTVQDMCSIIIATTNVATFVLTVITTLK